MREWWSWSSGGYGEAARSLDIVCQTGTADFRRAQLLQFRHDHYN